MMSLLSDLLETYNLAYDRGLVDNPILGNNGMTILPIYHLSRTSNGEDIFEITIDRESNAVDGRFLDKDEVVIFPITEESIIRSGTKIAPHAICDELSYLAKRFDVQKNETYMSGVQELLDYEEDNRYENFRVIGKYILKNTIMDDFLRFHLRGKQYTIDDKKFVLHYEEKDDRGKAKKKTIHLKKIFITFKLEREFAGDISITRDKGLHDFYISYVKNKNSTDKELAYCDITGELSYCVERHRGLIGTAKLVSISNNDETYYGRIKRGKDIYHISYEASQKAHNMLKYLIENKNHSRKIDEGTYLVNWLAQDIRKGGVELVFEIGEETYDIEDLEYVEQEQRDILGGGVSDKLKKYFLGEDESFRSTNDFHVLIIEKISNGRLSVKYHRRLSRSEAYERVMKWYRTTSWRFYSNDRSPSLYEIVNFIYGQENIKGSLSCENKKLFRSTIERLIPCIIEGQKLPKDIAKTTFYNLSNKLSYKNSWNDALSIGCSLIKKQRYDYQNSFIEANKISEVKQLKESRSFYYGKLMAVYEKIELDAVAGRGGGSTEKGKSSTHRITNSDKLWNSMIRTPERTRFVLESKIKPYMNMLKKNAPGLYVNFDKLITNMTLELLKLEESDDKKKGSLDEDFILGYYYQKNAFYQKKNDNTEEIISTARSGRKEDEEVY